MFQLPTESGRPRTITRWNEMNKTLNSRMEDLISKRYDTSVLERTRTYQLLDLILSHIDLDEVIHMVDDVDKYFNYFMPNYVKLTQLFADAFNIRPSQNKFIKSENSTTEFLVPTNRHNPILSLPIGLSYDEWKKIPSMRILSHNSSHLPKAFKFNIDFGSVKNKPSYAVIGIDIFVLCMKFIKYYQSHNKYDLPIMRENFIREELRFLVPNSVDIYLLNLVKDAVFEQPVIEPDKSLVGNFNIAYRQLSDSIDDVCINSWNSIDWFHTKWINGKSYIDLYNDLMNTWVIDDFKQNKAIKFLAFEPLVSVMLRLGEYQFDIGFNDKFLKFYNTYLSRVNSDKIWNNRNVQKVKTEIRASLENMN